MYLDVPGRVIWAVVAGLRGICSHRMQEVVAVNSGVRVTVFYVSSKGGGVTFLVVSDKCRRKDYFEVGLERLIGLFVFEFLELFEMIGDCFHGWIARVRTYG